MKLELSRVSMRVGANPWLYEMDLAPTPGAVTVLLGATQAGKTSLMRLMAGLDAPTTGQVRVDGTDVTGWPVRRRDVAMVYQQFINYPSLRVRDNIASPLRLRGHAATQIHQRVEALARRLHIEPFLDRLPAELSGGQQQRVALARALAKQAPLLLLDEPLVNLDYKLREELRDELGALFQQGDSTVIYATTEPGEALLLGGHTAVLDAGELLQYGPTPEVFHRPASLRVAQAFSDPPLNVLPALATPHGVQLQGEAGQPVDIPLAWTGEPPVGESVLLGLRANALRATVHEGDVQWPARVTLAEISGSDTFVHAATPVGPVVAQFTGVHDLALGAAITLNLSPGRLFVFHAGDGRLLQAPIWQGAH
jgi:glycerol transport system ATP-binding protein